MLCGKLHQDDILLCSNEREICKIELIELRAKPESPGVMFSFGGRNEMMGRVIPVADHRVVPVDLEK